MVRQIGPPAPAGGAMYDRGGEVLIEINTNGIAYNIYQAPNLVGFVMDPDDQGWYTMDTDFDLVVDGFSSAPTTFTNVILVFDRVEPSFCQPMLTVGGNGVSHQSGLGWYYPLGDLAVTTSTFGGNYSDTITTALAWSGCAGIRMCAFSDENYNLVRNGGADL